MHYRDGFSGGLSGGRWGGARACRCCTCASLHGATSLVAEGGGLGVRRGGGGGQGEARGGRGRVWAERGVVCAAARTGAAAPSLPAPFALAAAGRRGVAPAGHRARWNPPVSSRPVRNREETVGNEEGGTWAGDTVAPRRASFPPFSLLPGLPTCGRPCGPTSARRARSAHEAGGRGGSGTRREQGEGENRAPPCLRAGESERTGWE